MKIKKILAILICIVLVSLYMATLLFALLDFEGSAEWFKASLYLTIVLPVLFYAYLLIYQHLSDSHKGENKDSDTPG